MKYQSLDNIYVKYDFVKKYGSFAQKQLRLRRKLLLKKNQGNEISFFCTYPKSGTGRKQRVE